MAFNDTYFSDHGKHDQLTVVERATNTVLCGNQSF